MRQGSLTGAYTFLIILCYGIFVFLFLSFLSFVFFLFLFFILSAKEVMFTFANRRNITRITGCYNKCYKTISIGVRGIRGSTKSVEMKKVS